MSNDDIKLQLLYSGVNLTSQAREILQTDDTFEEYVTIGEVIIKLDDQVYAGVDFNQSSNYLLDYKDGQFILSSESDHIEVEVIKPPSFITEHQENSIGLPHEWFVAVHGERARVQPISGCANNCRFCNIPETPYTCKSIELLDESFRLAIASGDITNVLISGGSPKPAQYDYDYLLKVYEHFTSTYDLPFDLMTTPRGLIAGDKSEVNHRAYLEQIKAMNPCFLTINLEIFNDQVRAEYCPEKNRYTTSEYLAFIELAVEILGPDKVKSALIVGLEPLEETMKGVEALASIGCRVVLSPYFPYNKIGSKPTPEMMQQARDEAIIITRKYHVGFGNSVPGNDHNAISVSESRGRGY